MGFNDFLEKTILRESSNGVTNETKIGAELKAKNGNSETMGVLGTDLYKLVSNEFHQDIETVKKELEGKGYTVLTGSKKPLPGGYAFVMDNVTGNGDFVFIRYSRKEVKMIAPSELGLAWAVSAESADLKPQSFNIRGDYGSGENVSEYWYTMSQLYDHMMNEIPKRDDLSKNLQGYLIALIDYFTFKDEETKQILMDYEMGKFPTSQIEKNFGEIIGPFFITNDEFTLFNQLELDDRAEIHFPTAGNNPLLDYKIKVTRKDGKEELFSAKSGDKSNTIKPDYLITVIENFPHLKKQDGGELKEEFVVLDNLNKHTTNNGPIYAANALNKVSKVKTRLSGVDDEFVKNWIKMTPETWVYDQDAYGDFVDANIAMINSVVDISNKNSSNKGKVGYPLNAEEPSYSLIRYSVEKVLQTMSIDELNKDMGIQLDYNELFTQVSQDIHYIYLAETKKGIPWFKHLQARPGSKDVYLRSKNSAWKAKDKMGITPDKK